MTEVVNLTANGMNSPFALSEGYTKVSYKRGNRAGGKTNSFLEDIEKGVESLNRRQRRVFTKMFMRGATILIPATLLLKSKSAGAMGIDLLLPYLQDPQTKQRLSSSTYPNQPTQTPDGAVIPVDGSLFDKASSMGILPVEVVDLIITVLKTCGVLGLLLAMICLVVAGGLRMVGDVERSAMLVQDTIKGLGQIVLAPVIIILLALFTNFMLGGIAGLDLFY